MTPCWDDLKLLLDFLNLFGVTGYATHCIHWSLFFFTQLLRGWSSFLIFRPKFPGTLEPHGFKREESLHGDTTKHILNIDRMYWYKKIVKIIRLSSVSRLPLQAYYAATADGLAQPRSFSGRRSLSWGCWQAWQALSWAFSWEIACI